MRSIALILLIAGLITTLGSHFLAPRSSPTIVEKITTPTVAIADIIHDPRKYEGVKVQVSGRLSSNSSVSVIGFGVFNLVDEAGRNIVVLVRNGIPPVASGTDAMTVIGLVKSVVTIGSFDYPVLPPAPRRIPARRFPARSA